MAEQKSSPAPFSAIASDPDAFEAFYRENVEGVQRFVARRVADRELAADLAADIFLAAIESADSYRPDRGSPAAWLFGVARVVVSAERRRDGREQRATARLGGRRLLSPDDEARADERLDAAAESRRLFDAMADLSEPQRAVLELVAVDGLSLGEAAAALGIRPLAARARLHRARASMADRLAGQPKPDQPCPQPQEASP